MDHCWHIEVWKIWSRFCRRHFTDALCWKNFLVFWLKLNWSLFIKGSDCCILYFSCDQAALQMVFSVCLSVCPSHLFDYVPIIVLSWHFQELLPLTKVKSMQKVKVKGQGHRGHNTQLNRFRTVNPVWIHIWGWNDAYSLMLLRRGALLFFKVICQISRSHGSKDCRIWPRLGVSGL